ncbi:MAG: SDR family oxidoreductase, partial [Deltaproteobacteria bacterium]
GMDLDPVTDYARYKAQAEKILAEHEARDFCTVAVRPATVCGYSPRQRLDIITNIMTNHAVHNRVIKVFGGAQKRPSIHIQDMTDLYLRLVEAPREDVTGRVWNAGRENLTAAQIASTVRMCVGDDVRVVLEPSDDPRSYHISSERLLREFGFEFKRTIEDAVRDIKAAFAQGLLPDSLTDKRYFNVRTMQAAGLR